MIIGDRQMKTAYIAIVQKTGQAPVKISTPFLTTLEVDVFNAKFISNNPGSTAWVETIEIEETK